MTYYDSKTKNYGEKKPNRLINEKSPYLLQHAFNPVDWFPWAKKLLIRPSGRAKRYFCPWVILSWVS